MASVGARLNLYSVQHHSAKKDAVQECLRKKAIHWKNFPPMKFFGSFRPDTILFIVGMFFEDLVHPTFPSVSFATSSGCPEVCGDGAIL